MATKVIMPKLGLTMTEGKIVEWRKQEGEQVEKGEILYVLETEKVTYEVEASESGILGKILANVDDVVPVGETVAYILQPGEELPEVTEVTLAPEREEVTAGGKQAVSAETAPSAAETVPSERVKISPVAKKIAAEHNIDILTVKGTGPGGRIVKEDVLQAVEGAKGAAKRGAPEAPVEAEKIVPLSSMRKTIAQRMSESFQTAPHFWVIDEADATNLVKLHQQLAPVIEKETGVRLTYTDLFVKILGKALKERPDVNAYWTDEGIKMMGNINVGIAAAIPNGLIVPVIHDADRKSIAEIAIARAELVTKAREGKLGLDEMTGGTCTLNNVGAVGIKCIDAIINPPESAILSVGKTSDRPVVIDGQIVIRPMMDLSLSVDHRVLDGASGGRFLVRIRELIENPILLVPWQNY
ncbi:dihydrolipoamide acetyltransferase family protein [Chloroflexota bacterium]